MKLSGLGGEHCPVQPVPVPVQTRKLASVFGSVISIGARRSAPLIMIFEVSAFANNTAGIASKRRRNKTESSRFTVHRFTPTYCPKLGIPKCGLLANAFGHGKFHRDSIGLDELYLGDNRCLGITVGAIHILDIFYRSTKFARLKYVSDSQGRNGANLFRCE